jgi:cytoskeletal protein RodZ
MAIQVPDTPSARRVKPTREHALQIAERRKAARRRRIQRLRRGITMVSVAAFIGPFGVIYAQLAAGRDPALSTTQTAATTGSGATASASTSATRAAAAARAAARTDAAAKAAAAATAATAAQTTQTTQTASPAPVTTQQS